MFIMNLRRCSRISSLVLLFLSVVVRPCWAFGLKDVASKVSSLLVDFYRLSKDNTYCYFEECCNKDYIIADLPSNRKNFELEIVDARLFGQHIAKQVVVNTIGGHLKHIDISEKPLVMSFHGSPGTGKNYVAEHIVNSMYKNGIKSKFVHKYLGRIDFPLQSDVEVYKAQLVHDITRAVAKCPKSLFIFDEVEKMPAGLFDSIVSLLDNHAYTKELDFRQSIFIFLSNVAGPEIANKLKYLLDSGRWREDTTLHDFEQTLEITSYNLVGGLYRSEMIESHVVDHFIPFLPLELRHVENCIRFEFQRLTNKNIGESLISAVVNEAITFDESGVFSNNGCKRVSKKVESLLYNALRKNSKEL